MQGIHCEMPSVLFGPMMTIFYHTTVKSFDCMQHISANLAIEGGDWSSLVHDTIAHRPIHIDCPLMVFVHANPANHWNIFVDGYNPMTVGLDIDGTNVQGHHSYSMVP